MMRKRLFLAAGFLSLGLGIAGIFLPLLPTTPFVLLSAFCFLRSSRSRYEWLINHRVFGRYISDYLIHRAIPLRVKILSISAMWLAMGLSAYAVANPYVAALLAVIGAGVTWHLVTLRSSKGKRGLDSETDNEG